MRGILWLPLLVVTAGCWQQRYFTPRENLNGTGPDGDAAAVYQVEGELWVDAESGESGEAVEMVADSRGEVRLWSGGARARYTDDGTEVVDLRIGFELENTGSVPLEIDVDSVLVEELFVDGFLVDPLTPHSVSGSSYAEPGSTARLDLVFWPPTTYPRQVDSFSVRFVVLDADGSLVRQVTPFVPTRRRSQWGGDAIGWGGYYGYYGWGGYYGHNGYWGLHGFGGGWHGH